MKKSINTIEEKYLKSINFQKQIIEKQKDDIEQLKLIIKTITETKGWKCLEFLRNVKSKLQSPFEKIFFCTSLDRISTPAYKKTELDVILPIYNGFDCLLKCIYSVLSNSFGVNFNLILINDKSTDNNINLLLKYLDDQQISNLYIIKNSKNLGFIKTINKGLSFSHSNVILLNSDTIVTKNWSYKMHNILKKNKNIGVVTPLSNNATIYSIPQINEKNTLEKNITPNNANSILEKLTQDDKKSHQIMPTAVGFCMLIRRSTINQFGDFDEIYKKGYNEENDFCQRLKKNGYLTVAALNTYIYHEGQISFTNEKEILERENQKILLSRYPNYFDEVNKFITNDPIAPLRKCFKSELNKISSFSITIALDAQILRMSPDTGSARYVNELINFFSKKKLIKNKKIVVLTNTNKLDAQIYKINHLEKFYCSNSLDPIVGRLTSDIYHRTIQCYSYSDLLLISHYKKSVITLLDLISFKNSSYWPNKENFLEYKKITSLSIKLADKIIAISHNAANEIINTFNIPSSKVSTIYLGVNNNFKSLNYSDEIQFFINTYNLPQKFFLYVGTDFPHKNVKLLVNWYSQLPISIRKKAKLVLFLKPAIGGELTIIKKYIKKKNLENYIKILIEVFNNKQLNILYNAAFAGINLSSDEGFGLTNLEISRCKKPVIVLNTNINHEILQDNPIYVENENDFTNSVSKLINDRSFYIKTANNLYENSCKYQWDKMAQETSELYDSVLRDKTPKSTRILRTQFIAKFKKNSQYKKLLK